MNCANHPSVAAVASCQRCTEQLCGQCMQILDGKEYCEQCAEALVAESYVANRAREMERRHEVHFDAIIDPGVTTAKGKKQKKQDKEKAYVWLGFGGAATMIFLSLIIYAFPMVFQFDSALAAERRAYQALEDCRLVFEEIGYLLEDGRMPDETFRCADTDAPNIVEQEGDSIRVSHPDPSIYGLVELYVNSQSHEVIFVEAREV